MAQDICAECRWCRLGFSGGSDSLYYCTLNGAALHTDTLSGGRCVNFTPEPPIEPDPSGAVSARNFTYLRRYPEVPA